MRYTTLQESQKWAKYGSERRVETGKLDLFSHVLVSQIEAKCQTLLNIPDLHIRDVQNTWQTKLIYEGLEQKCPEVSAPGTGFITQCSLCSEPKLL